MLNLNPNAEGIPPPSRQLSHVALRSPNNAVVSSRSGSGLDLSALVGTPRADATQMPPQSANTCLDLSALDSALAAASSARELSVLSVELVASTPPRCLSRGDKNSEHNSPPQSVAMHYPSESRVLCSTKSARLTIDLTLLKSSSMQFDSARRRGVRAYEPRTAYARVPTHVPAKYCAYSVTENNEVARVIRRVASTLQMNASASQVTAQKQHDHRINISRTIHTFEREQSRKALPRKPFVTKRIRNDFPPNKSNVSVSVSAAYDRSFEQATYPVFRSSKIASQQARCRVSKQFGTLNKYVSYTSKDSMLGSLVQQKNEKCERRPKSSNSC